MPAALQLAFPCFLPCWLPFTALHSLRLQVWRVRTGQCLRRFDSAHSQGVTSLAFSRDGTHVLSASYDTLVRWGQVLRKRIGSHWVGAGCPCAAVTLSLLCAPNSASPKHCSRHCGLQGARHQERQDAQGVPRPLLLCQRRGVQLRRHAGGAADSSQLHAWSAMGAPHLGLGL